MAKQNQTQGSSQISAAHAAEYRIIKHDLYKVLALNAVYLIAVLVIFYTNAKTQYLERWFSHFVR